jgi:excisionase family DNA binding protein
METKRRKANVPGDAVGSGQLAPLLVSKRSAAQALAISPRNLTYLISSKRLPCRRIGRRTLIPYAALQQFARRDHPSPQAKPAVETPATGGGQQ